MIPLDHVIDKASAVERISGDEALLLFRQADLITLGRIADGIRRRLHPEPVVTYVVDRNINYTNICVSKCLFCAYYRNAGHPEAFVISRERLDEKIRETLALGGTQILLQGGLNPNLDLEFYLNMLQFIKNRFRIHVHGFSPPEIAFIATREGLPVTEVLKRMMTAGLDTMPGGGAEILVDAVRNRISPEKCSSGSWLEVMESAHGLGMRSTATMMFGHVESAEDIVAHLLSIRELQDRTGGFTAFIPWTFQPKNTRIPVQPASGAEYLRVLALSRIVLDNVDNLQASWVTQGGKMAQISLAFGANDFGSTMIEENVVAAAGVTFRLPLKEMVRLIENAGFRAVQRNCYYDPVRAGDGVTHHGM